MRKIILALVTILLLGGGYAQAQTAQDVEEHMYEYFNSIRTKDYDTLYGLLAPSFQKHLPKDSLNSLFSIVEDNPNIVNQMVDFDLKGSSESVMYDDVVYVKIDYVSERHLHYTDSASDAYINKTNEYFKKIRGDSFSYLADKRMFKTTQPGSVIMCIDMTDEDNLLYYFIPYRPRLLPYMDMLMPKGAVDELLRK